MPHHHDRTEVPYSPQQMFDLVADVERYPDFIPWCELVRIRKDDRVDGAGYLEADMVVRYKMFRERFRSGILTNPDTREIEVDYLNGPFKRLHNLWRFDEAANGGCVIDFTIEFEFRNLLLQAAAMQVFDKAFSRMSSAFIARADALYGASANA